MVMSAWPAIVLTSPFFTVEAAEATYSTVTDSIKKGRKHLQTQLVDKVLIEVRDPN